MLRRFEMYSFAKGVTDAQIDDLALLLRGAGRFIPEVLDSAVGRNRSDAAVTLVWEHAYESRESYTRYMRHPFHMGVLDRFLLPDSPECIIAGSAAGLGLAGYEIEGAPFRRTSGIRRLVAFRPVDGAATGELDDVIRRMEERPRETPDLRLSVVGRNEMGLEWMPTGWTHIWEQAYDDEAAMERAVQDEADLLGPPIEQWVSVHYDIDPARPEEHPSAEASPAPVSGPVYLVEQVEVRTGDADAYLTALEELYLPLVRSLGIELVSTWREPHAVGDHVMVMTTLRLTDWAHWDEARGRLVMDPSLPAWLARKRKLVVRGRRTFYEPTALSPP